MGDDDDGDALIAQAAHEVEELGRVIVVQGGGGLVEDEQTHVLGQRLTDLDKLLFAHAERADLGCYVFLQADLFQDLFGAVIDFVPVDQAESFGAYLRPGRCFLRSTVGNEGQLLVDDANAEGLGALMERNWTSLPSKMMAPSYCPCG